MRSAVPHLPILSAITGVRMYTKEFTPKMVENVDAHFLEMCSALCEQSILLWVLFCHEAFEKDSAGVKHGVITRFVY